MSDVMTLRSSGANYLSERPLPRHSVARFSAPASILSLLAIVLLLFPPFFAVAVRARAEDAHSIMQHSQAARTADRNKQ